MNNRKFRIMVTSMGKVDECGQGGYTQVSKLSVMFCLIRQVEVGGGVIYYYYSLNQMLENIFCKEKDSK